MSGVFQLLVTLRNKLLCTLRHLRQQLRHSLRASEIRLRRTVRTDFLLRVPAAPLILASSCGYHPAMSRVLPIGRFFSQPSILARATAIALCRDPSKGTAVGLLPRDKKFRGRSAQARKNEKINTPVVHGTTNYHV